MRRRRGNLYMIITGSLILFIPVVILVSCRRQEVLVGRGYSDSLRNGKGADSVVASNERECSFWRDRIDPVNPGNTNEAQYAAALVNRFLLKGDIHDLDAADSVLRKIDQVYAHTLSGPLVHLVSLSIMHHRFAIADSVFAAARRIGIKPYIENSLGFDVSFERGRYWECPAYLNGLGYFKDYNYSFRRSKYEHLRGNMDSAFSDANRALSLAGNSAYQKALAVSVLGDLQLHDGDLAGAARSFKAALRSNPADMHALLNLGWVSLNHDQDVAVARQLFELAIARNDLPDPYFRLYQMAQWEGDQAACRRYAERFAQLATDRHYERMYNKYLIELYNGVLRAPQRAEEISFDELGNRATAQTYAWYGYSLLCNHKAAQAYQVFKEHISGKPIEGTELYYAGSILKGAGHMLDANKCFAAALQNRYDLSPGMIDTINQFFKD